MTPEYFSYIIFVGILIILVACFIERQKIICFFRGDKCNETGSKIIERPLIHSDYKAIIGIDLGSTFSGYGLKKDPFYDYDTIDEKELVESQIIIYNNETGLCIGSVCYNAHFKQNPNNKNNQYFTSFKRNLDPKIKNNLVTSDYPGDEVELKLIIKEFLWLLRKNFINPKIKNYNSTDIKWVITVPPLWDIEGKNLMLKQAKEAGMDNLDVVLEPEAASLAIFSENNQTIKKYIKPGSKFLIVDAGGYTVDFSANKILENNDLEQLMIPHSVVKGSSLLNDKIFEFVKTALGVDKIKNANYSIIQRILNEIEEKKKNLNEIGGNYMELNIEGLGIICSSGSSWKFWSSNKECEKEIDGKNFSYTNKKMFIPKEYVNEMILDVTNSIANLVTKVMAKIKSVNITIFTGGFSYNEIFKRKIQELLEQYSFIHFMKEPQESVLKGAAIFGLKPSRIIKRIIPITIGIESYEKKEKEEDNCENEYIDEKNETRCQKYRTYVRKEESIGTEDKIEHLIYPNPEQTDQKINIYFSYEDEITNENKKELGSIDASDFLINNKALKINMKFSNYIKVTIIDENENLENSVLLSYPENKFL